MIQESKYTTLKFRIKELLLKLPAEDYKLAKKNLPSLVGLTPPNFRKLINTPLDSPYEPRPSVLIKTASFLMCTVEDLYTEQPKPVTIKDVHVANNSNLASELNLTA